MPELTEAPTPEQKIRHVAKQHKHHRTNNPRTPNRKVSHTADPTRLHRTRFELSKFISGRRQHSLTEKLPLSETETPTHTVKKDESSVSNTPKDTNTQEEVLTPEAEETGKVAPRIDEFPEKARPIVQDIFNKAREQANAITKNLGLANKVVDHIDRAQLTVEEIKTLASTPSPEDIKDVERSMEELTTELNFLKQAYERLQKGKDVPELFSTGGIYSFRQAEIDKYGETANPIKKIRQVANMTSSSYRTELQRFRDKLMAAYRLRTYEFLRRAHERVQENTEVSINFNVEIATDFESYTQGVDTVLKSAMDPARGLAKKEAQLQELEKWLRKHSDDLQQDGIKQGMSYSYDSLLSSIEASKNQFTRNKDLFLQHVQQYPVYHAGKILWNIAPDIFKNAHAINEGKSPVQEKLQNAWISQDLVDLCRSMVRNLRELQSKLSQKEIGRYYPLEDAEKSLQGVVGVAQEHLNQSQSLASSQEMLWHTARMPVITDILRKAFIASKQFQIEKYGEASFHNLRVGKDYVIANEYRFGAQKPTPKRYALEQYRKKIGGTADKDPMQEAHQVCFSDEDVYMPNLYGEGIAIGFSKAALFSYAQFMSMDGWHLFDKSFSSDDPASPGFAVDLRQEPMIICVESPDKQQKISELFRTSLHESPEWKDTLKDVEDWTKDHVVCVPHLFSGTNEEWNQAKETVRDKFFHKYQLDIPPGTIIPTGEKGEDPTRDKTFLYAYQPLAQNA